MKTLSYVEKQFLLASPQPQWCKIYNLLILYYVNKVISIIQTQNKIKENIP